MANPVYPEENLVHPVKKLRASSCSFVGETILTIQQLRRRKRAANGEQC